MKDLETERTMIGREKEKERLLESQTIRDKERVLERGRKATQKEKDVIGH